MTVHWYISRQWDGDDLLLELRSILVVEDVEPPSYEEVFG